MPSTVQVYVNPDATGAGDGTSEADAYTTLNAALTAKAKDLTASDEIYQFVCSCTGGSADTTAATISAGWTTDSTRYVEVLGNNTSGVWDATKYRLAVDAASGLPLTLTASWFHLTTLQVQNTAASPSTGSGAIGVGSSTVNGVIDSSLFRGGQYPIRINAATANVDLINSIAYGGTVGGMASAHATAGTVNAYSCVFIGVTTGVTNSSGTLTLKNCYAKGTTAYSGTFTQTTCAASDTTGDPAGLDSIAYSTANFTNVTAGSEDLSLPLGSALIDVGTDTSGDAAPLNFTDDIAGTARGATWDVGAFEYVSAGGVVIRRRLRWRAA